MNGEEELMREVLQRLARIEENTKGIDSVSSKVEKALHQSSENEKDIAELKDNQKWVWRSIAGIGVSLIIYVIQKLINF